MKLLIFLLAFFVEVTVHAATGDNCVFTQVDKSATTSSTQVLAQNKERRCLIIQNQGASTVYIKFGSAHSAYEGFNIAGSTKWEPNWIPVNSIFARTLVGATTITILEGM